MMRTAKSSSVRKLSSNTVSPSSQLSPHIAHWRANGVEGSTSLAGTTLRHLQEDAELHVEHGRLTRGSGYSTASRDARQALARTGAVLRLRQHNRFYVHASGVVNDRGRALIFVGASGTGKSTLAFALARQGWRMLGDDGVVLEPLADSVLAHGWSSPSMVSTSLAPFFPEMTEAGTPARAGDERKRVSMSVARTSRATLAGVVFVRLGVDGSLRPCGQAHALTMLIEQSPWVLLGDTESELHFRALQMIAGSIPAYELVHGPAELNRIGDLFDCVA
jgi:hypothetical protein